MLKILSPTTSENFRDQKEDTYPFSRIWINGRNVSIEKIRQETETAHSPFEESTFNFIRDWFSGVEDFQLATSGSTGKPKQITITRSQMIRSARSTARKIDIKERSTALVCIDSKYIGGKMMLVRSLTLGLKIMAVDPTANPLIRIPVDKCVQFTALVPYQINAVLESKHPHLLNNLDKVLIGGAPLSDANREQLDRFQCELYETYGMTETVSHIALRLLNTPLKQQYFEVLPGIEISQDARGCLQISGDYLEDPVITNDLVEIPAQGKFLWLGRWDSVINTGGIKVLPEKIEKELDAIFHKNHVDNRFFIAALPDERLGHKLVLILEGVQFSSELLNQSMLMLRSAVPAYEFPKEIYFTPKFVTTATQKVDRIQTLAGVTLLSPL
ncbi:MAG TPA: AMP-binding protein [Chryseosolibacter sp.]